MTAALGGSNIGWPCVANGLEVNLIFFGAGEVCTVMSLMVEG